MASASLNQAQRNHAVERIKSMTEAKLAEVRKAHTTPEVKLPVEKKIALIKAKRVKLREDISWRSRLYAEPYTLFDFSKHEKLAVLSVVGKKKIEQIEKDSQQAIDMIMLAGATEALAALAAFEAALAKA